MCALFQAKPARTHTAPYKERRRRTHYRQGNELLPVHLFNILTFFPRATNVLKIVINIMKMGQTAQ
jgi:hypothetical protein